MSHAPVQTIEKTSKKWKALQLLGGLGVLIGITILIAASAAPPAGVPGPMSAAKRIEFGQGWLALSAATWLFGRLGAWWHHG